MIESGCVTHSIGRLRFDGFHTVAQRRSQSVGYLVRGAYRGTGYTPKSQ